MNESELRDAVAGLGPWSMDIEIADGVSTGAFLDGADGAPAGDGSQPVVIAPRGAWVEKMGKLFPDGLEGRSFLDCGCNCGGYSFFAKEVGAGRVYGFDLDPRVIEQAWFVQENRTAGPTDDLTFDLHDLHDLPGLDVGEFDVALVWKIFHSLPDPMTALKLVADRTRELIIVNVATRAGEGGQATEDGYLWLRPSGQDPPGRLSWYPTGPYVIQQILAWCGFPETRIMWWHNDPGRAFGRVEVCGARDAGTFAGLDEARAATAGATRRGTARRGSRRR